MTTFVDRQGDLLADDADALVNPINCKGVMGAGVAKQFAARWPEMFEDYQWDCEHDLISPGVLHLWADGDSPIIVGFPTKVHWRDKSTAADIHVGLIALRNLLDGDFSDGEVRTIAIPALGCGLGGLEWRWVKAQIVEVLDGIDGLEVRLYEPHE